MDVNVPAAWWLTVNQRQSLKEQLCIYWMCHLKGSPKKWQFCHSCSTHAGEMYLRRVLFAMNMFRVECMQMWMQNYWVIKPACSVSIGESEENYFSTALTLLKNRDWQNCFRIALCTFESWGGWRYSIILTINRIIIINVL